MLRFVDEIVKLSTEIGSRNQLYIPQTELSFYAAYKLGGWRLIFNIKSNNRILTKAK